MSLRIIDWALSFIVISNFSKKEGAIIIGISVIVSSILYISYVTSR